MSTHASASSGAAKFIFAAAVAFSVFQLIVAAFHPLSSQVIRSLHVGFLMLLGFLVMLPGGRKSPNPMDWLLALGGFAIGLYHWIFEVDLITRAGAPETADIVVGVAAVALVFEASRRMMGWALPSICLAFLAYALFGDLLPSPLNHRGYFFEEVVGQLYLGTEGIYGIPTYVSASYIFLFILFGSFLERAGMLNLFNDIALGTVGHTRGGPAKVAVISSALMATVNGSGVANVVTTGQFTIPLMKRFGYRPAFAGAVEATASMGGQIMPPVMGAVAFIMAETLDKAYSEIAMAALVPALLYFATVLWMVHLEAGRASLHGMDKKDCPNALAAIRRQWYLLLPLAGLVGLLFSGYTPLFSGMVGLVLTAVVLLGGTAARAITAKSLRLVFWVGIGFAASAFAKFGMSALIALVAALAIGCWFVKGGRETLRLCVDSLAEGARHALPVGVACALVGVIISVMTLTGLATSFTQVIVSLGEKSLFLSLVLTMLACLVLGMGIPTIPNYIITSSLVGPALAQLGVPLLVSHMFVFYFGIMADLTPPVALAAFAASSIAKESAMKIGLNCLRIAVAGFVVPFMAVYDPALMLQTDDPWAVVWIVIKAGAAIYAWGASSIGYLTAPLSWTERAAAALGAGLLIAALPATDEAGLAVIALFTIHHLWKVRRLRRTDSVPVEL